MQTMRAAVIAILGGWIIVTVTGGCGGDQGSTKDLPTTITRSEATPVETEIAAATATIQAEVRSETATAQAADRQATATARVAAHETTVARERDRLAAAGSEFDGNNLPDGWEVVRPDPAHWWVADGALHLEAIPGLGDNLWSNEIVRPLPSIEGDLAIIVKLRVTNMSVESGSYLVDLRIGRNRCPQSVYIAVGMDETGPHVRSAREDDCEIVGDRLINFQLDQDVYFMIERQSGGIITTYASHDGVSWTYVNEFSGIPSYDMLAIWRGGPDLDDSLTVDWIHFEIPE